MFEILRKIENVALKLLTITQFLSPNLSIDFIFCTVLGVRCDVDMFKLTACAFIVLNPGLSQR